MRIWLSRQRLLWRRILSQPHSFGTIKLTPEYMVRDVGLSFYRLVAASPEVRRYMRDYEATVPLHTKRSPRPDDLRRLLVAGLDLLRHDGRAAAQRLMLEPLTKLSGLLDDRDTQIGLFEAALARRSRLSTRELGILIEACEQVLRQRQAGQAPALAERLDALRQLVVTLDPSMPAPLQTALLLAGGERREQIDELGLIAPADRTPAEWDMLIGLLLGRMDKMDEPELLLEAIAALQQALPLLFTGEPHTPEGAGPRLLVWVSIHLAAQARFASLREVDVAALDRAVALAAPLHPAIRQPLDLFEALAASAPNGRRGRYAHAWAVLSIDLLWHVMFDGGAELRRTVIDTVMEGAAAGVIERLDHNAAGQELFRRLHQCEAMWTDAAARDDLLRRYLDVSGMVHEPRRTVLRGLCHLGKDEEAEAEALFAANRGPAFNTLFNGSGHITFLPAAEVATHLENPAADPRFLPENCDFRMEKRVKVARHLLVTAACADPVYANRYFRRYTQSFFRVDRRSIFHLHLLGRPDDLDPDIREMIASHPRIAMSREQPPLQMPYYYATARFLRAPLFQEETRTAVMLTDMDIAFRASPHRYSRRWQPVGDVGLRLYDRIRCFPRAGMIGFKTPRLETWGSVNASCVYFGRNDRAQRFAQELSQVAHYGLSKFQDSGNSNWWIDQNILYASLRPLTRRIEGLRLFNLLDVGIPFGAYQGDLADMPPPTGHRPGMPEL